MARIQKGVTALRIVMLGHKRIPSREGGVEVVVEELAVRMAAQGHTVTCLNRSGHHVAGAAYDKERLTQYRGVRLADVPTIQGRGLAAMSASVFGAFRAAFSRCDVVHFHAEGPAFLCWLPRLLGKRVVVTVHGLDHRRAKWGRFASWYILQGERNAVRFAHEIIVLSAGVQQYFLDTYGRQTRFIPNGVERGENHPAERITALWGLKKDDYILYLGRLVPEKGIAYLIDAFRQVKTDKKLVIAGGSSDTEAFAASLHQQAAGDDRILFTGFVEGQPMRELFANAYVYTLPSDLEGMPLSLLEAMSFGNCCLTSDIPECAEVLEDKGVTFPKGDVEALRDTLQRLCDAPETVAAYKAGAADYICGKYNWDNVTERTLELYR